MAFKSVYGWQVQSSETETGAGAGAGADTEIKLPLGIWGWISGSNNTSTHSKSGGITGEVKKLHLLFGGDEEEEEEERDTSKGENLQVGQDVEQAMRWWDDDVEAIVSQVMVLCSTYLTVVSAGLDTTRAEIERLLGFIQPLFGERTSARRERAVLDWRWVGQDLVDSDWSEWEGDGWRVLEKVLEGSELVDDEIDSTKILLDTVYQTFGGLECSLPAQALGGFRGKEMQTTMEILIRERALSLGVKAYHREMNAFLDKKPIPLPWHTLAMVQQRAQSIACEEIEVRYFGGEGVRSVLKEFRKVCIATEEDDYDETVIRKSKEKKVRMREKTEEIDIEMKGMVVPKGGLYQEYFSANKTALQEHHMRTLDSHWRMLLKNRLLGTQKSSNSGTSSEFGSIKDHTEFLLAVDRVRREYLETCIPSPEALSVLENLDEMQQTESILFLQTLAKTNSLVGTNGSGSGTGTGEQSQSQQQQQPASTKGLPSKRYSITNHPAVALNGRELMIHPAASDDSRIVASGNKSTCNSISATRLNNTISQGADAPTDLEQQIAEILRSKRQRPSAQNESNSGSSLQYAWIWDWLHSHEGSSRQNVVACDKKIYTSSKWMILPAKDLARTRKDWKISYGDRSYQSIYQEPKVDPVVMFCPMARHLLFVEPVMLMYSVCDVFENQNERIRNVLKESNVQPSSKRIKMFTSAEYPEVEYSDSTDVSSENISTPNTCDSMTPTTAAGQDPSRCGHVFRQGEAVYHCADCSANDKVVLCSNCFYGSNCVNHQWRIGEFQGSERIKQNISADDLLAAVIDELGINQDQDSSEEDLMFATCGCGDPKLFQKAFDCNHHLPQTFRPVPHLKCCNYLFERQENMYRCITCFEGEGVKLDEDVWICGRCFDEEAHRDHETEQTVNWWNEGLYCRCGDVSILKDQSLESRNRWTAIQMRKT
ncbi:hypothetical protein FBU30_009201 [Linnemannia zychae]|nr:hypothetical protein FBU30_009201 [Linnemannia zychae]